MVVGGNVRRTPSVGCDVIGHVVRSWLIRAWAQSRAVDESCVSEGFEGRGFASSHNRLPRSNVYGIGFVTVTGLDLCISLPHSLLGGTKEE